MPLKKGPDGRSLHMSNTGVDPMVESSESENELLPQPSAPIRSVRFLNIMDEASARTQSTEQTPEAPDKSTAVICNRFGPDLPTLAAVHNWVPESHPADGTEAHTIREDRIKKERDGLRRATAKVCKTGHTVLVIWWAPFDPLNRRGTWFLEIFDCRFELWGEFGIEAHGQCESSTANDIVQALGKAMIREWKTILSTNRKHINPICEWNQNKRKLQNDKYNERSLPSLREVERELRHLIIYTFDRVPRGQGGGSRDDQDDRDENKEKQEGDENDQKPTKDDLIAKRKAAQKRIEAANFARKYERKKNRDAENKTRVEASEKLRQDVQRNANGAQTSYDSDSQSLLPRSNIPGASPLDMTEGISDVPTTPSRNKKNDSRQKPNTKKAKKTEEEDADLKRIRAAGRKEREEEKQKERVEEKQKERREEEQRRELAARKEEAELQNRAALGADQDSSSDTEFTDAVNEAWENASHELEASEKKPTKEYQEKIDDLESRTDSVADKSGPKDHKGRLKPCATVTPTTPDPSDSDSVRPLQPSTPVKTEPKAKPKAKPAAAKTIGETKKTKAAKEFKTKQTKSAKTEEAKASKVKEKKKYKSEEFVADSDLEDDETDEVKLPSDKLQSGDVSVKTIEATTTTVHSEHGNDVVEAVVETITVAVAVQQRDGPVERTELTETTTARSDTSEDGETVEHTTRVETVTQLDVTHQEMPHNCPPSSLECDLQDGLSTPPPPSPTRTDSSSSSRKRNNPSSAEEPQVDQVTKSDEEKDSPSAPASASRKKRRIILPTSSSRGEGTASAEGTDSPRLGNNSFL